MESWEAELAADSINTTDCLMQTTDMCSSARLDESVIPLIERPV